MAGRYTNAQIEFLRSHAKCMTYRELTDQFNKIFGQNKKREAIIKTCVFRGISARRAQLNAPVPVGTEAIEQGYVRVKTAERLASGSYRWRNKHVLLWEAAYGAVPKGHYIIFADGNKCNFSLDNLVKVTRREFLYLNWHKLRFPDAELTKSAVAIARLRGAIVDKETAMCG